GFPTKQITTGGTCHLDARMIERHLADWHLGEIDLLFIENVGNLVCPSSYDLGEAAKVVLLSVTEGEDKPLKYPSIFFKSELLVITKMDLLPYVPFDRAAAEENARRVHPGMDIVRVSCTGGTGFLDWLIWIEKRRQAYLLANAAAVELMAVRRHIEVSGIVQGVGFRPYIYRLATDRHLSGNISNTSSGVTIEVQGPPHAVQDFVSRLPVEVPPLARITDVSVIEIPCNGDREFRIVTSRRGDAVQTLISPDVAICDDCLRELFDPADRRYGYPFINCTNCGPRFTIVHDIPYDRPYTSMAGFPM